MVMVVRPVHPENAYAPNVVTVFGMTVFSQPRISVLLAVSIIALLPVGLLYVVLPSLTVMVSRLVVLSTKALYLISVTDAGMLIDVSAVKLLKDPHPITVTRSEERRVGKEC